MSDYPTTIAWEKGTVSAAWHHPARGKDYLVLAHGAGGTMETPNIRAYADALAARGLGAVRFNFGYAEAGKRGPERAPVLESCWRSVATAVAERADRVFLGGRSMGGRMASHIVAHGFEAAGLVFLAYPLHPPGKPERIRDAHLYDITVPMLFIQGTRDPFSTPELLTSVMDKLGSKATLHALEGGDHSHRVKKRPQAEVIDEVVGATIDWLPA